MKRSLKIAGGVLCGLTLLVGLTALLPVLLARSLAQRVAAQIDARDILMQDLRVNCFGRESAGPAQARGNGALVLTRDRLHFITLGTPAPFAIPLVAITGVDEVKSHLGKTTPFPLLRVSYREGGQADAAAFYVQDLAAWQGRLAAQRSSRSRP